MLPGFLGEKSEDAARSLGGWCSRKSLGQRGWSPDPEPLNPSPSQSVGVLICELGELNKNIYLEELSELHPQMQGGPMPHHIHTFPP